MSFQQSPEEEYKLIFRGIDERPYNAMAAWKAGVMSPSIPDNGSGTERNAVSEMVAGEVSNLDDSRTDGENNVVTKRLTCSVTSAFVARSHSGKNNLDIQTSQILVIWMSRSLLSNWLI